MGTVEHVGIPTEGEESGMAVRFTVLASGSRGNSSLVRAGGAGLLIDLGLGPRTLEERLTAVGASLDGVCAAVLTHTHGDHVGDAALTALARRRIPLYCHEGHHRELGRFRGYARLAEAGLLRDFDDRPFLVPGGLNVEPFPVRHDGGPTFGFRVEGRDSGRSRPVAVGYLADSGCWTEAMAEGLADADLVGVEFNHDVDLQRRSGRPYHLIARNLGDGGHLSNAQGASLVSEVLRMSRPGAVRHVVLLHLSEQCNRPDLALAAARGAIRGTGRRVKVHVASQWSSSPDLLVEPGRRPARRASAGLVAGFPWELD